MAKKTSRQRIMKGVLQYINFVYERLDGPNEMVMSFDSEHNIHAAKILTICNADAAKKAIRLFRSSIENKTVIEVGAGIGYFAVESAKIAREVIAIEADPAWTWLYVKFLYQEKQKNLTWIFGAAEAMIGRIYGDVCFVFTCSDLDGLKEIARRFAPQVILGHQWRKEKEKTCDGQENITPKDYD